MKHNALATAPIVRRLIAFVAVILFAAANMVIIPGITATAVAVGIAYPFSLSHPGLLSAGNIAFDPTNGNLYLVNGNYNNISNPGSDTVSVISGKTNTVVGSPIHVGKQPVGIAFDPANGNLYVANNYNDTVSVISGKTNTVVGSPIHVGQRPSGVAFDPANGNLYVANMGGFTNNGTVSVISGKTNTVVGSPIPIHRFFPMHLTFDPTNGNLYVTDYGGGVTVISGKTNTVVGSPILLGPHYHHPAYSTTGAIAFNPGNGNLYVITHIWRTISVISGKTNTVVGSPIQVFKHPWWSRIAFGFDPANGNLYAVNTGNDTVSVISGKTNTVVGSPIHISSTTELQNIMKKHWLSNPLPALVG